MAVMTAPSSPAANGGCLYYYASAPSSPATRMNFGYPWDGEAEAFDFAAGFGGDHTPILAAADELFEGGRIRPLVNYVDVGAAVEGEERGRIVTALSGSPPPRPRRAARSLSPMRGDAAAAAFVTPSSPPCPKTSLMGGCGSKKWSLKDLFLFRSASEGRATGGCSNDPLLKYTMLPSSSLQPVKPRSADGRIGSMSKRRGPASEAHCTSFRAAPAPEEMRRRTPLPFHRNSLFGYLRSNPAIHSISRKLSGVSLGRSSRHS